MTCPWQGQKSRPTRVIRPCHAWAHRENLDAGNGQEAVHGDNTDHISAGRDSGAAARPGRMARVGRLAFGVMFTGGAAIHVAIVITGTETYRHFADTAAAFGAVSGVLGATATGAFLLATQSGLLTVTAVLASLYPAVTVLLAATILREHIHRAQAAGLVLCGLAVGLVAGG